MRCLAWWGLLLAGVAVGLAAGSAEAREYWFPSISLDYPSEQVLAVYNEGPLSGEYFVEGKDGVIYNGILGAGQVQHLRLPDHSGPREGIVPAYRIVASETVRIVATLGGIGFEWEDGENVQWAGGGGVARLHSTTEWDSDHWVLQTGQARAFESSPWKDMADPRMHGSFIAITAGGAAGRITVMPSIALPASGGLPAMVPGDPYDVTLAPFEAWVRFATPPHWRAMGEADWSGTRVLASTPVALFSGQQCALASHMWTNHPGMWPLDGQRFYTECEPTLEQVPAVVHSGRKHVFCRIGSGLAHVHEMDVAWIRVVAVEAGVDVELESRGRYQHMLLANAGDWDEFVVTEGGEELPIVFPLFLNATGRVLVIFEAPAYWIYADLDGVFTSGPGQAVFAPPLDRAAGVIGSFAPHPHLQLPGSTGWGMYVSGPGMGPMGGPVCDQQRTPVVRQESVATGLFHWSGGLGVHTIDPRNHCPPGGGYRPDPPRGVDWTPASDAVRWTRPLDIGDCGLFGYRVEVSVDGTAYAEVAFLVDDGSRRAFQQPIDLALDGCHLVQARVTTVSVLESVPASTAPRPLGTTCGSGGGGPSGGGIPTGGPARGASLESSGHVLDSDGDGIHDHADNCPGTPNRDQSDADGDGAGDACRGPLQLPPPQDLPALDRDGDGIADAADNCPTVQNHEQRDADHDEEGDACDADLDGDRVPNALDNCPYVPNDNQADNDEDGMGDLCADATVPLSPRSGQRHGEASAPSLGWADPAPGSWPWLIAAAILGGIFLGARRRRDRRGPLPWR